MKLSSLFLLIFFVNCGFSQVEYSIRDLKAGKFKEDSSYIYSLPFEKGRSYFLIQGYESKMSHKNERALDFKMEIGSKIFAARDGVVIALKEDSNEGGLKEKYLPLGNHISIQHNDGSVAHYWHLQFDGVLVSVGDSVSREQLIGLSGNTGYTAFPHLHFEVVGPDLSGNHNQLPTRFQTSNGIIYLRPAKFYRN